MTQALIMAGGRGERMGELTRDCPKPMLQVGCEPLIYRCINQLLDHGVEKITISVGYLSEKITEWFGESTLTNFVHEDQPLGTAGALSLVEPGEWIVVNGDVLCEVDWTAMLAFHRSTNAAMTVGYVEKPMTLPYGVLELDGYKVQHLREKPCAVKKVVAGAYVVGELACYELRKQRVETKTERVDMTDLVNRIIKQHDPTGIHREYIGTVSAFPILADWQDIGTPADLEAARKKYYAQHGCTDSDRAAGIPDLASGDDRAGG